MFSSSSCWSVPARTSAGKQQRIRRVRYQPLSELSALHVTPVAGYLIRINTAEGNPWRVGSGSLYGNYSGGRAPSDDGALLCRCGRFVAARPTGAKPYALFTKPMVSMPRDLGQGRECPSTHILRDSTERRLAAILAADIAGYSRLMGEDEAATVRDLKAHQAVVLPLVGSFGGPSSIPPATASSPPSRARSVRWSAPSPSRAPWRSGTGTCRRTGGCASGSASISAT